MNLINNFNNIKSPESTNRKHWQFSLICSYFDFWRENNVNRVELNKEKILLNETQPEKILELISRYKYHLKNVNDLYELELKITDLLIEYAALAKKSK